jgi:hypothetical protein
MTGSTHLEVAQPYWQKTPMPVSRPVPRSVSALNKPRKSRFYGTRVVRGPPPPITLYCHRQHLTGIFIRCLNWPSAHHTHSDAEWRVLLVGANTYGVR